MVRSSGHLASADLVEELAILISLHRQFEFMAFQFAW